MAFEFYKIEKLNGKYVLKKLLEQYSELDAINKFNELFNLEVERKLKLNSNIEQVIDYVLWKFSIRDRMIDYDFVPEFLDYIISDVVDVDSAKIKKAFKKSLGKHYIKEKKHYYRREQYVK